MWVYTFTQWCFLPLPFLLSPFGESQGEFWFFFFAWSDFKKIFHVCICIYVSPLFVPTISSFFFFFNYGITFQWVCSPLVPTHSHVTTGFNELHFGFQPHDATENLLAVNLSHVVLVLEGSCCSSFTNSYRSVYILIYLSSNAPLVLFPWEANSFIQEDLLMCRMAHRKRKAEAAWIHELKEWDN